MTYAPAKFEVAMSNCLRGMHLQEIFDLTLTQGHMKHCPLHHVTCVPAQFEIALAKVKGVKVTQIAAQYPCHHVTYAPAKFDVATSHG